MGERLEPLRRIEARHGREPQEPAEALRNRAQRAHILGDHDAAERLRRLATAVEYEDEYAMNVDRGMPCVRRRADAPRGATVGWYFRHDAVVRAERRRIGVFLRNDAHGEASP
jgi:hypothetical protein